VTCGRPPLRGRARSANALTLAPNGRVRGPVVPRSAPEPILALPCPSARGSAARLGSWASRPLGVRRQFGRIDVRVGAAARRAPRHTGVTRRGLRGSSLPGASPTRRHRPGGGRERSPGGSALSPRAGGGPRSMGSLPRPRDGLRPPVASAANPKVAFDPAISARFVREGRAAALVKRPGVVGVTRLRGVPDGRAFLVMEYVEGEDARGDPRRRPHAAPGPRRSGSSSRCAASSQPTLRGVVHRDLKRPTSSSPPRGRSRSADFGVARVDDHFRGRPPRSGSSWGHRLHGSRARRWASRPTDGPTSTRSAASFRVLSGTPPFRAAALLEVLPEADRGKGAARDEPPWSPAGHPRRVRGEGARQAARGPLPQRGGDAGGSGARPAPPRRAEKAAGR